MASNKKPTIYIETTIVSAYFDFKNQDAQRKRITRQFWNNILPKYTPVISDVVVVELRRVVQDKKAHVLLKQVFKIKRLASTKKVEHLAQKYTVKGIIRKTKLEDALHLASAAVYNIDFLISWNYKDLVRAVQRRKIAEFHKKYKLHLPTIATPLEFFDI